MPVVHRSEASRWQASLADASGPSAGISEIGSVVTAITRPAPILTTAASRPCPGPTSTSSRAAPRCGATMRSNSSGVIFPSEVMRILLPVHRHRLPAELRGLDVQPAHALHVADHARYRDVLREQG